ncbi:glutaminyl-peptide cyclotransferase [Sphingomonas insulae]|uniref:Glutamine cyclotransferase n=2 Tax=Sphingomonas insulae TaxID=424800 RepID=A0ABN1HKQ1_9SPHN|nr:glutaminyl-peptide cyclotransferase [Sphingomonas insulae]
MVKVAVALAIVGAIGGSAWQATRPTTQAPPAAAVAQAGQTGQARPMGQAGQVGPMGQAGQLGPTPAAEAGVPVYAATVVARFPHDTGAFTEGLLFCGGALYESTGKEGASDIRRVNLFDGKVLARARIAPDLFGEGIGCWKNTLLSVTWKTGLGFRWALPALTRAGKPFRYAGEGWGMTSDGRDIILSDGTPTLRRMDPATFAERGRIAVSLNGRPLQKLNELEAYRGRILANVWMTGFVARIDPATGKVDGLIDLRPIIAEIANADPDAVANGIAYDPSGDRLFVTGKYWPTLFEIKLGDEVGRAQPSQ